MYKIRIWSCDSTAEVPAAPRISGCTVEGRGWTDISEVPVPAYLRLTLSGICASYELTVDPEPAGTVRSQLEKFCLKAADSANGAVERLTPLQGEETFVFCGEKNYYPEIPGEKASLALWFAPCADAAAKRVVLFETLGKILPYALPGDGGDSAADASVWHGTKPVRNVYLKDKVSAGSGESCYLAIDLNPSCFEYSEWKQALTELLCRLCELYTAFFGQVITGPRQVAAGIWQGIPMDIGSACVLGPAYSGTVQDASNGKPFGDGFLLFEEPDGPYIRTELISKRKKSLFGHPSGDGRGYLIASDFTRAQSIPATCFGLK